MTEDAEGPAERNDARLREAKAAARETIGKLIGDDDEVKAGKVGQRQASVSSQSQQQTQTTQEQQAGTNMTSKVTNDAVAYERAGLAKGVTRLSWSAIFGGVVIAVAVQLLLGILGTGIGLSMVDPVEGTTPGATGFGIGAGIYWLITTIIALGAGGYAAARVSGVTQRFDALTHGLVVWGVTLILTLYLLTSAVGGIIGGAFRTVGTIANAAGSTVGAVGAAAPRAAQIAGVDETDVRQEAAAYLSDAPSDPAAMTAEQAQTEIAKQLPALARGGSDGARAESRIVDVVAAQRKIDRTQAQAQVDRAKADFVKAKDSTVDTAKSAADTAAGAAAGTSFVVVFALFVGAVASAFGAIAATRRQLR